MDEKKHYPRWVADISLLAVTAIWGLTFVTVKNAIELLPPFSFNFMRFTMASLIMLCLALPFWRRCSLATVIAGIAIGVFLFGGYSFQTVGLIYTSASKAGFITGLSVILVPIMLTLSSRQLPGAGIIIGAVFATIGLALLSFDGAEKLNRGDFLVLLCAVSFALQIIFVGKFAPHHHTIWLVTWQLITVAFLSGLTAFFVEPAIKTITPPVWRALVITALLATCAAQFVQNYMQRFTTPAHTAIIFTMEPVFAAAFAVLLLHESLSSRTLWGSILILAGIYIAELKATKNPVSEGNSAIDNN